MNQQKISKKHIGIILIILVIFIGFFLVIFGPEIFDSPTPTVSVTKINESGIPNGKIISLTDKDFEDFPQLAPVIRDNTKHGVPYANGTRINYIVKLSWNERERFLSSKFSALWINQTTGKNEVYYEYNGKYYEIGGVMIP